MHNLNIDIETFSSVPIKAAGAYKYIESSDFEILLFAYSLDGSPVYCIDLAQGEKLPPWLAGEEQDLLTWCILQRADDGIGCEAGTPSAIIDTITYPRSWDSYSESNPIVPEVRERVVNCMEAWARGEQAPTHEIYAPTLPYYGYSGDGHHNYFHG